MRHTGLESWCADLASGYGDEYGWGFVFGEKLTF